ncbi:redox-regulated ATPase YchF [Candidatus Aenigmatarchaeota archaeon]
MLEIALVGTPNSGKSSFFKAATMQDVKIASYPFTTIEPNAGVGYVKTVCPCKALGIECKPSNSKCVNGERFVPVKLWDIAGLVPGAHEGKGRGNAFLDDIRRAEGMIQVIDFSGKTDNEGNPTDGYDPTGDIEMLENEIDYWMLGILKKLQLYRQINMKPKELIQLVSKQFSGLGISEELVEYTVNVTSVTQGSNDIEMLRFIKTLRKKSKPMLVAANKIDITDKIYEKSGIDAIPCSAVAELALRNATTAGKVKYSPGEKSFEITGELNEKEKKGFDMIKSLLDKYGSTGIQKCINKLVFDTLDMIVVYPVENENKFSDKKGNPLPDAILLKKGSTPKDLAFKVHEDIGKKFIGAVDCKTHQNIGAKHELKDGDIVSIKSGR